MNTNETKAKLWNMCIEKGVFNKVKGDNFSKMQETFEKIIKGYEQVEPSLEVFNKVIDLPSYNFILRSKLLPHVTPSVLIIRSIKESGSSIILSSAGTSSSLTSISAKSIPYSNNVLNAANNWFWISVK